MITADAVMPLLLAACPSFQDIWQEAEADNYFAEENQRLHYIDAGDFSRHLVQLLRTGQTDQLTSALRVIELLHTDGDDYVQELATVGYLEGIQFATSHVTDVNEEDFVPLLGPESLRWWNGLVKFWDGTVPPPIRPTEQP